MDITKNLLIAIILIIFSTIVSAQETSSIQLKKIAEITIGLNHFPSDSEKKELSEIMSNESLSDNVRILAHALFNVKHNVTDTDKKE